MKLRLFYMVLFCTSMSVQGFVYKTRSLAVRAVKSPKIIYDQRISEKKIKKRYAAQLYPIRENARKPKKVQSWQKGKAAQNAKTFQKVKK